jgi:molybdopterin synthase catalytic subunit
MTVRLQTDVFDPGALLTAFTAGRSETGAVTSFTGIARPEAAHDAS